MPAASEITAHFVARAGVTALGRLYESGGLRLRRTRGQASGAACEAILVNTAGGIVGGDRIAVTIELAADAEASFTTVAAEKLYRAHGAPARIATRLVLAPGTRALWLPQETILFDGARLARRLDIELAADARLIAVEAIVFGRLASGETAMTGTLRDDWRVRRAGRLAFADATRLDGAIGATLDRPAVGGGARATALMLVAAPDAEAAVEPLRAAFAGAPEVEAGASARDGIAVARLLARSPQRLRAAIVAALAALGATTPRTWA